MKWFILIVLLSLFLYVLFIIELLHNYIYFLIYYGCSIVGIMTNNVVYKLMVQYYFISPGMEWNLHQFFKSLVRLLVIILCHPIQSDIMLLFVFY